MDISQGWSKVQIQTLFQPVSNIAHLKIRFGNKILYQCIYQNIVQIKLTVCLLELGENILLINCKNRFNRAMFFKDINKNIILIIISNSHCNFLEDV